MKDKQQQSIVMFVTGELYNDYVNIVQILKFEMLKISFPLRMYRITDSSPLSSLLFLILLVILLFFILAQ